MSEEYECPHCGAPIKLQQRICEYCKSELFISSIAYLAGCSPTAIQKYLTLYKNMLETDPSSTEGHIGLGLCYLQQNMYPLAKKEFEKVIQIAPDNAFSYYYWCLSTIAGRRIKNLLMSETEQIITYLKMASDLDLSNNLFKLLQAIVQHDFYVINCMREPTPKYKDLLDNISLENINKNEIVRLKKSIQVKNFNLFGI